MSHLPTNLLSDLAKLTQIENNPKSLIDLTGSGDGPGKYSTRPRQADQLQQSQHGTLSSLLNPTNRQKSNSSIIDVIVKRRKQSISKQPISKQPISQQSILQDTAISNTDSTDLGDKEDSLTLDSFATKQTKKRNSIFNFLSEAEPKSIQKRQNSNANTSGDSVAFYSSSGGMIPEESEGGDENGILNRSESSLPRQHEGPYQRNRTASIISNASGIREFETSKSTAMPTVKENATGELHHGQPSYHQAAESSTDILASLKAQSSLRNARKEVLQLRQFMAQLNKDMDASNERDKDKPFDVNTFNKAVQDEEKMYATVFEEVIRQVTVNMTERGELLNDIRNRYRSLLRRVPKQVSVIYADLAAFRALNTRLSDEMFRIKDVYSHFIRDLDGVRTFDVQMTKDAEKVRERLATMLAQMEHQDAVGIEFNSLFKLQRDRLEESIRVTEHEKRVWSDAAMKLASRIAREQGVGDLKELNVIENTRMRDMSKLLTLLDRRKETEMRKVTKAIEVWRAKILETSSSIIQMDQENLDVLIRVHSEMALAYQMLSTFEVSEQLPEDHPSIKVFNVHDALSVWKSLLGWLTVVNKIGVRFVGDIALGFERTSEELATYLDDWTHLGSALVQKQVVSNTASPEDYKDLLEQVGKIRTEVSGWVRKLESRASGDDGLGTCFSSLQRGIEDKYTSFSTREFEKPMTALERKTMSTNIGQWLVDVQEAINLLKQTAQREQNVIPILIEQWVGKLTDRMGADNEARHDENHRIHNRLNGWVVDLFVREEELQSPATGSWDDEFQLLSQQLNNYSTGIMREADTLANSLRSGTSGPESDVTASINAAHEISKLALRIEQGSGNWLQRAMKLLKTQKERTLARYKAQILDVHYSEEKVEEYLARTQLGQDDKLEKRLKELRNEDIEGADKVDLEGYKKSLKKPPALVDANTKGSVDSTKKQGDGGKLDKSGDTKGKGKSTGKNERDSLVDRDSENEDGERDGDNDESEEENEEGRGSIARTGKVKSAGKRSPSPKGTNPKDKDLKKKVATPTNRLAPPPVSSTGRATPTKAPTPSKPEKTKTPVKKGK